MTKVQEKLTHAFSDIHMTGVKGHKMMFGLTIGGTIVRYEYKDLLHDVQNAKKDIKALQDFLRSHDISKSMKNAEKFDIAVIDAADKSYKADFNTYLMLARSLFSVRKFRKVSNASPQAMKEIFGPALESLKKLLQEQQKQIQAWYEEFY